MDADVGLLVGVVAVAVFAAASPAFLRLTGTFAYVGWAVVSGLFLAALAGSPLPAVLVAVIASVILRAASNRDRQRLDRAAELVRAHARELSIRRRQLLRRDLYGVVDARPWQREVGQFVDKVLMPEIGPAARGDGFGRELADLVDQAAAGVAPPSEFRPDMTPVDYEEHVAQELRRCGWGARTTRRTGDQGVDVIADKGPLHVVIQCKLYGRPVGNDAVQQALAGQRFEQATHAAVVSNAAFTRSARELASAAGVLLMHHEQLGELEARLVGSRLVT